MSELSILQESTAGQRSIQNASWLFLSNGVAWGLGWWFRVHEGTDQRPLRLRSGRLAAASQRFTGLVRGPAAMAWCDLEDTRVSIATGYEPFLRNQEPMFRLCFARLVTHYWANPGFLEDGQLLRDAAKLAGVPTFLAHGRQDISARADIPVALAASIPDAELFISETEGHGGRTISNWMTTIADRLAE